VRVLLDGRPINARVGGTDVKAGRMSVGQQRLYSVVNLARVETHRLTLLPDSGVTGYAFTFG
jgi:hypothetical protein